MTYINISNEKIEHFGQETKLLKREISNFLVFLVLP